MKRTNWLLSACALSLVFGLSACGSDDEPAGAAGEAGAAGQAGMAGAGGKGGSGGTGGAAGKGGSAGTGGAAGKGGSAGTGGAAGTAGTGGSAQAVCGDGAIGGSEACDDNNTAAGDGCSDKCEVEPGWTCDGTPSACSAKCGDGQLLNGEKCDDGNAVAGDGCSDACEIESGYACSGEPSECSTSCGDGKIAGQEACDDGNSAAGDGCTEACALEAGYSCTGEPSVCAAVCGDGAVAGVETCDDGNTTGGDGCGADCIVELGYGCSGAPSACSPVCGDGLVTGAEACDDSNAAPGDGCSAGCAVEAGWACAGVPSVCTTTCGDGVPAGAETCDDGATAAGDGCDADCLVEAGWACDGAPSVCTTNCGDGKVAGAEACDDGNAAPDDGCSAGCAVEAGWACTGSPSVCAPSCGDGLLTGTEACDDGNAAPGDGCSATCTIEQGFTCTGAPSVCATTCGDGTVAGTEACDDGNTTPADGCSASCAVEAGFACTGAPSVCATTCGDGVKAGTEGCDDGNTTPGDCCSATCTPEAGCEVELNDTIAVANDFASLAVDGKIKGFVKPKADKDVFKVTVPSGKLGHLTVTTLDGFMGTTCASNKVDNYLTIFSSTAVELGKDDDSADGYCALAKASGLAPGDYFVETKMSSLASSSILSFDYVLQFDLVLATCGNGVLELGEQCDDSNTDPDDGCGADCKLEAIAEIEPNGACASATGPIALTQVGAGKLVSGSITPAADLDYFAFTLPGVADLRVETFDQNGPGTCASIDTVIQAFKSDCTALGPTKDQGGISNCSLLNPAVDTFMRRLPAGTYYVQAKAYSSTATFNYRMMATLMSLCGNGVKESTEECDGGATCAADCTLLPVCGDGARKATEQCDDGNTTPGDGCSALCEWETTAEVEPNATLAEADQNATDNANLLIDKTRNITAAIGEAGDVDTFKVSVATPQVVRFEVFDSTGYDCAGLTATTLKLLNSTGTTVKTDSTSSGIGVCPALVVALDAGTYYMQVNKNVSGTIPAYMLQAWFQFDAGTETEPNGTQSQANAVPGMHVFVLGDHQTSTDLDVFAITVPPGASVRAELIEGDAETCESNGIDSYLTLRSATFASLATDDDDGRGYCSMIDGTGATPLDTGARNLAGGTYYLEAKSSTYASGGAALFNYRLVVTIR